MKKKIVAAAVLAVSFFSFSALAQAPQTDNCNARTECRKAPRQKCDTACTVDPFAGLSLSDAQKTQLADLRKAQAEKRKAERAADKAQRRAKGTEARDKRAQEKRDYLNQVKAIVGPEQYVVFLENFYVNGPAKPKMAQGKNGRDKKGGAPGKDVKYKMPRRQDAAAK